MSNAAAANAARRAQARLVLPLLGWSLLAATCAIGTAAAFGVRVAAYLSWIGW